MSLRTPTSALAAVVCCLSGLAWAGPTLTGPYHGDAFGTVELRTEGDRLVGTPVGGGACKRPDSKPVLEGEFQGNVFIGKVTVCQSQAPMCEELVSYPALLFYNPDEGALGGTVKVASGCQPLGLGRDGLVVLRAKKEAAAPAPAPAPTERPPPTPPPATAGGSAASIARERSQEPVDVPAKLKAGQDALLAKSFPSAERYFMAVLAKETHNPQALVGLGVTCLLSDRKPDARRYLEQARAAGSTQTKAEAAFWMAVLNRKEQPRLAQEALKRALDEGWAPDGNRLVEEELLQFAREGGAYESLVQRARGRGGRRAQGREPQGAGSASP